ncbi:MAG: sialidase family protein [Planctomycetota bacterium]|jgi:hypothetical protein
MGRRPVVSSPARPAGAGPRTGALAPRRSAPAPRRVALAAGLLCGALLCGTPDGTLSAQYPAVAPELGVDVRVDTDTAGLHSSTLPRAVTTASGALHVVWQDYRDAEWSVWYRRLPDLGNAPADPEVKLSALFGGPLPAPNAIEPRIATDGDDTLYVTWHVSGGLNEAILFVRSLDDGLSWSAPALLPHKQLNFGISSDYASPPELCADASGHVAVVWAQNDGIWDQIYVAASTDAGATFTQPVLSQPVNIVKSGHSEWPRIACDGSGNLVVGWLDHRTPPWRDVYVRHSSDFGLSFDPGETRLGEHGTAHLLELVAEADDGSVDGSSVVAAWIDIVDGVGGFTHTHLRSIRSTDGGASFPETADYAGPACEMLDVTGGAAGNPSGGPSSPPWSGTGSGLGGSSSGGATPGLGRTGKGTGQGIALCGTNIYGLDLAGDGAGGVWAVTGQLDLPILGEPTRVVARHYDIESGLWTTGRVLSRAGPIFPAKGLVPVLPRARVAAEGKLAYVTWLTSGDDYTDHADVVVAWTTDGGATWSPISGVTTNPNGPAHVRSDHPDVVASGGRAALVWDDRRTFSDHQTLPLPPLAPVGTPDVYVNVLEP